MKTVKPRNKRGQGEAVILFSAAGHNFAIAATAVDEIRPHNAMQPFTGVLPYPRLNKVRHIIERDKVSHYVVDAAMHFQLPPGRVQRVLVLHGSRAAVAVERIDRMAEITSLFALPRAFRGEERDWYRGLAVIQGEVVPVVDPASFLSKAEVALLCAYSHPQPDDRAMGAAL